MQNHASSETTALIDSILLTIASKHLGADTLDAPLRSALQAAFVAGAALGSQLPKATEAEIANAW